MPMPWLPLCIMPAKPIAIPMAEIVHCEVMAGMVVPVTVMPVMLRTASRIGMPGEGSMAEGRSKAAVPAATCRGAFAEECAGEQTKCRNGDEYPMDHGGHSQVSKMKARHYRGSHRQRR